MNRRQLLQRSSMAALGWTAGAASAAPMINRGSYRLFKFSAQAYSQRAIDLVVDTTVFDMLAPFSLGGRSWLQQPDTWPPEEIQKFKDSGIDVFHIAVGVGGADPVDAVVWFLGQWNGFIATHSDHLMRIDSAADMQAVRSSGKVGVLLGVQNSDHFTRNLADIDRFWDLGQRVSQLTYNARNRIGNGSTERVDGGLSDYGVAAVARMNEVGMAVDTSHCGDQTTLDAIEVSTRPVFITHSNARALVPGHPRCKPDEIIRAMAAKGGVMGITGVRMFVRDREPTTVEHMLDHYDHVANLVGIEHVGLGSDIDLEGYDDLPAQRLEQLRGAYKDSYGFRDKIDIEGVDHPQRMFDLTEGLIRRGYSDDDIRLVLGGNFQRVLGEIWDVPPRQPRGGRRGR